MRKIMYGGTGLFSSYKEYLESWIWKDKRDVMLGSHPCCEKCNSNIRLEVHHLTYERLENEKKTDLMVVCHKCHQKIHKNDPTPIKE